MKKFYSSNDKSGRKQCRFLASFAILLIFIGFASLILSIIDLFKKRPSVDNHSESQGGLKIERPLWPSSGKGFWVGLVLIATGLVGVLSASEGTRSSIIGFTALSTVSTILSFYMMITSIILVQNDVRYAHDLRSSWKSTEFILNSLLIAAGTFGSIIGILASIFGCVYGSCCTDQREAYLCSLDAIKGASQTPASMRHLPTDASRVSYPYQSTNFRMAM